MAHRLQNCSDETMKILSTKITSDLMLPIAISLVVLASPVSDASRDDGFFDTFVTG